MSGFLTNSESWNLSKGEESELEKMEIQALKSLFDLPLHTPSVAIIYTFGLLYTTQQIDKKQLIYLYKVLNRNDEDSAKKALLGINEDKIGWSRNIRNILRKYKLPLDFDTIKSYTRYNWKNTVTAAIEKMNKERLLQDLHKKENGTDIPKTKTKSIISKITREGYVRSPEPMILRSTKYEAKTILIARYGMLDCGVNFKGTMRPICVTCNTRDNEDHRLNECPKWGGAVENEVEKINFEDIYSDDIDKIRAVIKKLTKIWNTKNANGSMIRNQ